MFTISVAAPDRNLLTLSEMKDALGVTGTAQDARLTTLGLQVSDLIASECKVPTSGGTPATLRSETIVETIRPRNASIDMLVLSRRFVSSITTIVEDGVTLASTAYELESDAGIVTRLSDAGDPVAWSANKIVVTYVAGFQTVPPALKLAAVTVLKEQWSATDSTRDPLVKSEDVPGVMRRDYWVGGLGGKSAPAISSGASGMLDPYKYHVA